MRTLLLALLLALTLPRAAAAAGVPDWPAVVEQLRPTVAVLTMQTKTKDGKHEEGSCSSIVLNREKGYVLTAAHCIGDDMEIAQRDVDVVKKNARLDLAVVKTRLGKTAINITLAPSMPPAGSSVAVIGFPFGARTLTIQVGVVANPDVEGSAWIAADLLPGDSGGALVDVDGRLIGVTSGYEYSGAAHMGVAIPLETVRAFVGDYLADK